MNEKLVPEEIQDSISIKRAQASDLPEIWKIISANAKNLADQGYSHWADYYSEELVSKMISKLEVYVATQGNVLVGTGTLSTRDPKYYTADYLNKFTPSEQGVVYVLGLATAPEYNKRGVAKALLQFIEEQAIQRGIEWIRLDCRAEIPGLIKFYENRGFVERGRLEEVPGESYCIMEKQVLT
jgi:ribosomal protein S18 acetylase RimI-like enzyme